ncbi:Wzt carbohydrate-binding domain-containing protein, partial [Candidatus Nomurabacteria bacterium]|nr:Wzt carbohydrate-binding domain-containing protein [Candidatus Nomurabacteria bacterium]
VATIIEPDILIVDEALSVGDIFFQQKCYARLKELKECGVTILFVTHAMGDIVQYCQKSLLFNNNRLEYMGSSAETVKRYLLVQQQQRLTSFIANVSQESPLSFDEQQQDENKFFWPTATQFTDISAVDVVTSGIANCTGVALCSGKGVSSKLFTPGERATIFCEFELSSSIEVPIGGFVIKNEQNIIVHGKNSLQYDDVSLPNYVKNNQKIRFRFDVSLDIAPGEYTIDVGLAAMHKNDYDYRYITTPAHLQSKTLRLCNLSNATSFTVIQQPVIDQIYGSLHSGVCNLVGSSEVSLLSPIKKITDSEGYGTGRITVFHVTHWKAGSQWIKKILKEAVPDLYVDSKIGVSHFLKDPINEGMVYPTVYVTKEQFDSVPKPMNWRHFVFIRDLRDTLVSGYFSLKVSHSVISTGISSYREKLVSLNMEDGLIYLIDEWLHLSAAVQSSWLAAQENLIKYEDVLNDDVGILTKVLIDHCQLPVSKDRLKEVIINNRFERLTGGRKSGTEDISVHERKGVAGDWQNYFTPKVKEYFKVKYGKLLISTGYESSADW